MTWGMMSLTSPVICRAASHVGTVDMHMMRLSCVTTGEEEDDMPAGRRCGGIEMAGRCLVACGKGDMQLQMPNVDAATG